MKGWYDESSHILYVFDTPNVITYVDPETEAIAVMPEYVDAFKEDNSIFADIIVGYNFSSLTVNAKPFEGHTNDDITEPETTTTTQPPVKVDPEFYWQREYMDPVSQELVTMEISSYTWYPNSSSMSQTEGNLQFVNTNSVSITFTSSDDSVATVDEWGNVNPAIVNEDASATITATFDGNDQYNAKTVTLSYYINVMPDPDVPTDAPTEEPL